MLALQVKSPSRQQAPTFRICRAATGRAVKQISLHELQSRHVLVEARANSIILLDLQPAHVARVSGSVPAPVRTVGLRMGGTSVPNTRVGHASDRRH